jgi:Transposase IS116/IS110/IS902 family
VLKRRVQEFASYARLGKCVHQSAGKKLGTGGAKMGNVHLKWAFSEAAVLFLRHTKDGKKILAGIEKKHGKGKALSILAHTIGRAVFYMLSRGRSSRWRSSSRRAHRAPRADDHEPEVRQRGADDGTPALSPTTHTRVHGMSCPFPEPGDNGCAYTTSLVMRRPARGPE